MSRTDESVFEVPQWQKRSALALGAEAIERLSRARVLVVGVGGAGAAAAEMICRAGVGHMTIVDGDTVEASNRNRQLPALSSTEGAAKTAVVAARLLDINPGLDICALQEFVSGTRISEILDTGKFDFVVDAIDSLSPKIELISASVARSLRIVSSMGAGAKLDPSQVQIGDIAKSNGCALAKAVRRRLRELGIEKGVEVVFSPESPLPGAVLDQNPGLPGKRSTVGTVSYMPVVFGCFCAAAAIRRLSGK